MADANKDLRQIQHALDELYLEIKEKGSLSPESRQKLVKIEEALKQNQKIVQADQTTSKEKDE